ncbi:PfaB family protein [Shewanella sedimentimangrovi]|uniref:PfaB family protein n=1 Tax=Shewanella sedimentimangrovi TaxID=2814293 RepID=A0ABX7R5A4_9GAMM|nr:PfaB family protein [Shewanella sedimentimangrovi]QSX38278.1 PfaB family protein [Shewanella sedimentimangrovi]
MQDTPAPLRLALCAIEQLPPQAILVPDANGDKEIDWPQLCQRALAGEWLALGKNPELLLLPALAAAQARMRPLALLQGLVDGDNAIHRALAQAKRTTAEAEILFEPLTLAAVLEQAHSLSSRTHPVHGGFWSMPPHQARVLVLVQGHRALVLTQGTARPATPLCGRNSGINSGSNGAQPYVLPVPLPEPDWPSIQRRLSATQQKLAAIDSTDELHALINQALDALAQVPDHRCLVLMGQDKAELIAEADALSWGIAQSFRDDKELTSPCGSAFSPSPVGDKGLALVFPGVGTASHGMLAGLHLPFGEFFEQLEQQLHGQGLNGLDDILRPSALSYRPSLAEQAVAGVGASYVLYKLLEKLGIRPAFALGYSMGEAAMAAALGLWQNPFALVNETLQSSLFTEEVSGSLRAVRRLWREQEEAQSDDLDGEIHWQNLVVRLPAAAIRPHLAEFPRAYIAIAQGPSTVLAGDEAQCKALVKRLGKRALTGELVTAMHTPVAQALHDHIRAFYTRPTTEMDSAALPQLLWANAEPQGKLDAEAIGGAIAACFSEELDFGALVTRARKQGARIFVEVGAGRQTSGLIEAIGDAENKNLLALPTEGQGGKTLLKTLARLLAHGVSMDLDIFRPAPLAPEAEQQIKA